MNDISQRYFHVDSRFAGVSEHGGNSRPAVQQEQRQSSDGAIATGRPRTGRFGLPENSCLAGLLDLIGGCCGYSARDGRREREQEISFVRSPDETKEDSARSSQARKARVRFNDHIERRMIADSVGNDMASEQEADMNYEDYRYRKRELKRRIDCAECTSERDRCENKLKQLEASMNMLTMKKYWYCKDSLEKKIRETASNLLREQYKTQLADLEIHMNHLRRQNKVLAQPSIALGDETGKLFFNTVMNRRSVSKEEVLKIWEKTYR